MKPVKSPVQACAVGACLLVAALSSGGCRRPAPPAPAVASPSVSLDRTRVALGSPLAITYRFVVAKDAHIAEDYRVMLHVVDNNDELMWTDDHTPPVPTTRWAPGQTVEYTRTVFVPVYPYVGEATLQVGLYSTRDQQRIVLTGDDMGQKAYRVAKIEILPQTDNVFLIYKDGWHPAETAAHNAMVEWQWTKKDATLAFKNPNRASTFYLDVDNPGGVFKQPQHVELSIGGQRVDQFELTPGTRVLRKVALTPEQLGSGEMAELLIDVDKTFVPALLDAATTRDRRELGIRVFHAFLEPR